MYSLPMTHQGIGEFEQMVLLAIAHLRDEAYGIPIVEEIERRTGRSVARAAVYVTLRRLEDKGFDLIVDERPDARARRQATPVREARRRWRASTARGETGRRTDVEWARPRVAESAMSAPPCPPRLPRAVLRYALPDDTRDVVDGDLHEIYVAHRAASGAAAAATWYWLETLSFAMRFTLDRVIRALRSLFGGDAAPSSLDLRLGARMLAKSPGLTLVGGFGMAVGVALAAGAYAFFNSYFYPKLPLNEGDRIVALGKFDPKRQREDERLLHDFRVWQRELRSVVDLGAFLTIQRNLVSKTGQGEPIKIAEMTASGFRLTRVPPLLGRTLIDADERFGAPRVVVIGYDVWQSQFAGDQAIVGREIRIGRDAHTIVGVMPRGFRFPINHQYWIPLRFDPRVPVAPGTGPNLDVFGRLARGVSKEAAQAELSRDRSEPRRRGAEGARAPRAAHRPLRRHLRERRGGERIHRLRARALPDRVPPRRRGHERGRAGVRTHGHAYWRDCRAYGVRRDARTHRIAAFRRGVRPLGDLGGHRPRDRRHRPPHVR